MGILVKLFCIVAVSSLVNTQKNFTTRVRNFSIELLYHTGLETENHSVLSPFGIWTLLTSVSQGADGNSYDQLQKTLNHPKSIKKLVEGFKHITSSVVTTQSTGVTLLSNNFIFVDKDFHVKHEFKENSRNDFDSTVLPLDFKSAEKTAANVNRLISKASEGLIDDALSPDDFSESQMILSNVIYFKGLWSTPFNKSFTSLESFHDDHGVEIGKVNMMFHRGMFRFTNVKRLNGYVIELPYGDDQKFSFLAILPYPGVPLVDMFRNFESVNLGHVYTRLDEDLEYFGLSEVVLRLPRFKIMTNFVLNKPLNSMGITDIFEPTLAQLTRMTDESVYISQVLHKAGIEVTETGTVAAAATSATVANRNSPPEFNANRPFAYLVMEKTTQTILFGGMYSKPSIY